MDKTHIPLYTLNSFLKFDRKLYQVFGLPLGRPIPIKSILYAIVLGVIELVLYFLPLIGNFLRLIPPVILIAIPIALAWLLTDIGTEDRSPVSFFRSFFLYNFRKIKGDSAYRGRTVARERDYVFNNYFFKIETPKHVPKHIVEGFEQAKKERHKTLRYLERIHNPDEFFRKLEEEKNKRKKRKWVFF